MKDAGLGGGEQQRLQVCLETSIVSCLLGSDRSLTSKSVSSLVWETVSRFGQQGITLLSTAILAHLLTPASYGVMGMASPLINFAATFNDLGIPTAIVQRPKMGRQALSSLFWANLLFSTVVTLLLFLSAPLVAQFFRKPDVLTVFQVLSLTFLITGLGNVQHALFYGEMNLRPSAMAQIASSLAGLIVAVIMAVKGMGVWSLVGSALVSRVVDTVLMWVLHPWRPLFMLRWDDCRTCIEAGLPLSGFGIVNFFARNADNLIIGRSLGPALLGYYQNSYSLMYYPQQAIIMTLANGMLASFSQVREDIARFRQALLRLSLLVAFVLFPAMLGMAATADLIVKVVLGPQWGPAGPILTILAIAGFLQTVSAPVALAYVPTGNAGVMFRWSLVTTTLTVSGFLVGALWGITGVAVSYAVVQAILVLPNLFVALRLIQLPVSTYLRSMVSPFGLSATMALAVLLWRKVLVMAGFVHPVVLLVSSIVIGGAVYIGLIGFGRPKAVVDIVNILESTDVGFLRTPLRWLKRRWS